MVIGVLVVCNRDLRESSFHNANVLVFVVRWKNTEKAHWVPSESGDVTGREGADDGLVACYTTLHFKNSE
jgi:hypothetical protein